MKKDILIIGESCRDIFVYCDTDRLCPDVPVPILSIINQSENGGMSKNVQRNIESKIKRCDILTNSNWQNITKTRYVHNSTNHTFFRVDSPHNVGKINLSEIDFNYKIIVISDYDKGFLSSEDILFICKNHNNVFIDTKKILGPWINEAKYIKINDYEYKKSLPFITEKIKNKIIHTMGGDGCDFNGIQYKVNKSDVKDTSGAGDSFMAALVIEYLRSEDIDKSIKYANKCASEVVKHRGVTII